MERVKVMIPEVPPDVRAAVEADAAERGVSRDHAVTEALADAVGVAWETETSYPFRGTSNPDAPWILNLPVEVKARIKRQAKREGASMARLIVAILALRYGLPVPPSTDRRKLRGSREAA